MIKNWGKISAIPPAVILAAEQIKHLNYKTTTPAKFRKNTLTEDIAGSLMTEVSELIGIPKTSLDYVYFSAAKGADPHVDLLDPDKFNSRTFIIPVILPQGDSVIIAQESSEVAKLGHVYEFNHEKVHAMTVEDTDSGCVVIMIAILK